MRELRAQGPRRLAVRLLLIRHGESRGNAEGRLQGQREFPLSELGTQQVRALGERLAAAEIGALYSSPLRRARETAEAVAGRSGVEVEEDIRLQEYDFGELSGLTWPEINDRHPEIIREYQRQSGWPEFPGDEGRETFLARVREVFSEIVARHSEDETVAVVTHGGPIIVYVFETLGRPYSRPTPFQVGNASITTVQHGATRSSGVPERTIVGLNDACHLVGLDAR